MKRIFRHRKILKIIVYLRIIAQNIKHTKMAYLYISNHQICSISPGILKNTLFILKPHYTRPYCLEPYIHPHKNSYMMAEIHHNHQYYHHYTPTMLKKHNYQLIHDDIYKYIYRLSSLMHCKTLCLIHFVKYKSIPMVMFLIRQKKPQKNKDCW